MMITCAFCGDVAPRARERGVWLSPSFISEEQIPRDTRWDSTDSYRLCVHVLCGHCDKAMQDLKDALNSLEAPA